MAANKNEPVGQTSAHGLFPITGWTMVRRAQDGSQMALNSLFQNYRDPLLIWLRARHYSPHDAEDLVQSFCAGLLRHDFLKDVGREKGKFRTFLLTSLKNHLSDDRDNKNALKRGGGQTPNSLQETDDQGQPLYDPVGSGAAPDEEFDRIWAKALLDNALRQLESECARTGHAALCAALEPVMFEDETAAPYRKIAERLGMSEGSVKTAACRIRARLKGIIREEVRQTVDNEEDLEEEIRYLFSLFRK
jgi:RNA polymerase sigma-70 factor (ECF subfamily)